MFQTFAERVFRASVGTAVEAVLGTLATAGEVEFAAQTFRGQRVALVQAEFAAFVPCGRFRRAASRGCCPVCIRGRRSGRTE